MLYTYTQCTHTTASVIQRRSQDLEVGGTGGLGAAKLCRILCILAKLHEPLVKHEKT